MAAKSKYPTVELVTMWYNEEYLAPLFFSHYHWVDRIHLIFDVDTTDGTMAEIQKARRLSNINVIPFKFPDMMDDILKARKINEVAGFLHCDWIGVVDADEFVFAPDGVLVKAALALSKRPVVHVPFFMVYRHRTDCDIDRSCPPLLQRRHGDPVAGINYGQACFDKPVFARSSWRPEWLLGNHDVRSRVDFSQVHGNALLHGAHWAMADDFAVKRRVTDRRDRQSRVNLEQALTVQHHNITADSVRQELRAHLDDPLLF